MLGLNLSKNNNEFSFRKNSPQFNQTVLFEENPDTLAFAICRQRMLFAILAFLAVYLLISIRIFDLCLTDGIRFHGFDNATDETEIYSGNPISRADITDRNGIVVATSLPTVNLYANPKHVRNATDIAEKLSLIFPEIPYDELLKKLLKKNTSFSMIKYNLSPSQQAEVNNLGIPALEFQKSEKRIYPQQNLLSHVLGYTNVDNKGTAGLENALHNRLTESSKPLQLTVDIGIQDTLREQLIDGIKQFKANAASAIVMNVKNGEVIAMVSLPDYDPNLSIPVGSRSLFNFATQGVYEAGSVFKTFNTALALESGKVKVNDKFDATKPVKIQGVTVADYKGENRWLSVGEILIHSSNIGSALMISKVGKEKQRQFMQNLGFDKPLSDFEVLEKGKPLFLSEKQWRDNMMATIAYGYGISVTPLHIVSAFSALINGGIYHYPTIIKSSVPTPAKRIISEQTSDKMRHLLRDVVIYGSGRKADVAGYQVLGKTGTANKIINGKYKDRVVITSFLAAFPESDPQYALIVVLDEPKGPENAPYLVTSAWNAAPLGGKIIAQIAPQLNVQADFDLDTQRQHVKAAFLN